MSNNSLDIRQRHFNFHWYHIFY